MLDEQGVDQEGVPSLFTAIVLLPAQIVRTGRRVISRIMNDNRWLKDLFRSLGAPAQALYYLAKQNDPDPHHNLWPQEANSAPLLPPSATSARRRTPKVAFQPIMLQHRAAR